MAFTRDIVLHYISNSLGENGYTKEKNELLERMSEPIRFSSCQKHLVRCGTAYKQSAAGARYLTTTSDAFALSGYDTKLRFDKLMDQIFAKDDDPWQNIVVAVCMTSRLVVKAASTEYRQSIYDLTNWLIRYMRRCQDDWIISQGGWDIFLDYYWAERSTLDNTFCTKEFKRVLGGGLILLSLVLVLKRVTRRTPPPPMSSSSPYQILKPGCGCLWG